MISIKKQSILLLMVFVSLGCSRATEIPTATLSPTSTPVPSNTPPVVISESEILSSGVKRHFLLHVPASYDGSPTALIFNFHGYGSNSKEEEVLTGMSAKADEAGFIVVYPDGTQSAWFNGPIPQGVADRQFVRDLINHISILYNIDPRRIYATGMSNGGGMANRVACNLSDLFAAVAPNAGAYDYWKNCDPSRPIPLLAFHGLDDQVVPYEGFREQAVVPAIEGWAAEWAERNGCDPTPIITTPQDTVTVRSWSNCIDDADVILYSLENHGHSWPGSSVMPSTITSQAINATDIMWDFFQAHPMP
jgi:polyhydroxybutyrate depolymerase